MALKSDGTVVAWGDDTYGQTDVPAGLAGVVALAGGAYHSLALKSDGTVVAWGDDTYGQTDVPAGLAGVVALAGGAYHSLALKSDGTVVAWGSDTYGQTSVPTGLSNVVAVAAGGFHSLALKSDGTVVAWGDDYQGQTDAPAGLTGVVALAGGAFHSLALKSDGTVVAWGSDQYGQTNVPAGLTGVVAISAGFAHSLALKSDGTVVGWGDDTYGQTNVPATLYGASAIAAGGYHNLALSTADSLGGQGSTFGPTVLTPYTGTVATFTDINPNRPATAFAATIDWGDNTTPTAGTVTGSNGQFTVSGTHTYTLPGQYTVTTTITGPGGPLVLTGTANVGALSTTTMLGSSTNPSVYGQSVTLTATVTTTAGGAPVLEGSVDFVDTTTSTDLGTAPVNTTTGQASVSTGSLSAGGHIIAATYSDGTGGVYAGSDNYLFQSIARAGTTTTLTLPSTTPTSAQTFQVSATVAPVAPGAGTPTGTVTFTVNSTTQDAPLTNGTASITIGPFAAGSVSISATYNADTNFMGSASGTQSQQVNNPAPTILKQVGDPVPAGSPGFSELINGTGFLPTSVVSFDSQARTTKYVSATQLRVYVTRADLTTARKIAVTVTNPTPGGGVSNTGELLVTITGLRVTPGNVTSDGNGGYLVPITVTNIGYVSAVNARLLSASLGGASTTTPLPVKMGTLTAGQSKMVTLSFPASAGTTGQHVTLLVRRTYQGDPYRFQASQSVTLP